MSESTDHLPVTMREWYDSGRVYERPLTMDDYRADMRWSDAMGEAVHHWEGQDRDGRPLRVAWTPSPRYGWAVFYVYEITGDE